MRRRFAAAQPYKIVVPVSGGKDSQACLKLAVEEVGASSVLGLFCDTQWEHPWTPKHIEREAILYGVRIETITAGSVPDRVRKYGRFPMGGARFCSDELKISPSARFYEQLARSQGCGFQVFSGVRKDESHTRAKKYRGKVSTEVYAPHEIMPGKFPKKLAALGVELRLPIIDWSARQVFDYVGRENVNPLYAAGFERVGCFPCLAAGDAYKEKCFRFDETGKKHKVISLQLEKDTGRSMWETNSAKKRNDPDAPCGFCLFS